MRTGFEPMLFLSLLINWIKRVVDTWVLGPVSAFETVPQEAVYGVAYARVGRPCYATNCVSRELSPPGQIPLLALERQPFLPREEECPALFANWQKFRTQ